MKSLSLAELTPMVAPVSLAADRRLPVLEPLRPLLAGGGLLRGSVVAVEGSTSLALALAAGPSAAGSWCAAVGFGALGLVAAAESGIDLDRLAVVTSSRTNRGSGGWAWVVAALVDGLDMVLARTPAGVAVAATDARRLGSRVRERGSVLVVVEAADDKGGAWPIAPDLRLSVARSRWHGLGEGCGHLQARRVQVGAAGRGASARRRELALWLPGPESAVQAGPEVASFPRTVSPGDMDGGEPAASSVL